jgi:glutathione S-transferase
LPATGIATSRISTDFTEIPQSAVLRAISFLRRRIDDFLSIIEAHLHNRSFVVGDRPTIADLSMVGYLFFPKHESGYDFAVTHPAVHAWLARVAVLSRWRAPYDLLRGTRMQCYAS